MNVMKAAVRLCGLVLVCGMVFAEEPVDVPVHQFHPKPAVLKKILDHKISTEYNSKTLDEAIQSIRDETGASIIVDSYARLLLLLALDNDAPTFAAQRGESVQQVLEEMGLECRYIDSAVLLYSKQQLKTRPSPGIAPPALTGDALKSFAAALQNLKSADFDEREKGSRSIEALGESATTSIQDALKSEADPEARQRLEGLLALYARETFDDIAPETALQLDKLTSKITIDIVDAALDDAETLRQIKLPITWDLAETNTPQRKLTFHVREMPAGDAIRWLARESGTQIVPTTDGFKLVARQTVEKK